MGGLVSVFRPEKRPLLLAGLEGVGKTTTLLGLKRLLDPDQSVQPTAPGSTYECATCGNLTITVMTVSPLEEKIRPLLEPEVPLLVLANKQDLPGAWDARTVAKYLQLDSPEFMSEWEWYVQPCSVMTASGREALCAGLEWLVHDNSASGGAQESVCLNLKTSFV